MYSLYRLPTPFTRYPFTTGIKFYDPEIVGDTPEAVEHVRHR